MGHSTRHRPWSRRDFRNRSPGQPEMCTVEGRGGRAQARGDWGGGGACRRGRGACRRKLSGGTARLRRPQSRHPRELSQDPARRHPGRKDPLYDWRENEKMPGTNLTRNMRDLHEGKAAGPRRDTEKHRKRRRTCHAPGAGSARDAARSPSSGTHLPRRQQNASWSCFAASELVLSSCGK